MTRFPCVFPAILRWPSSESPGRNGCRRSLPPSGSVCTPAFDADEPDSKGVRAGDKAADDLADDLRYYDCRSERLRPGRAKDWNGQLLEVAECRRLCSLLFKQTQFLEEGKPHPKINHEDLLKRAQDTLEAFTAACVAADGPEAQGYDDGPLDPFAVDCLPMWRDVLNRLNTAGSTKARSF